MSNVFRKGEYFSLLTYACVICLIVFNLLDLSTGSQSLLDDEVISTKHIEEQCIRKCPDENRTNSDHIDCSQDCYITQCTLGCTLWEDALESSCKEVCTKKDQDGANNLYCEMGCNNALNRYFNWLIDEVGTPSAPALVADTLTAKSLSLEWEIPPRLAQITNGRPYITQSYLVQWRYEEVVGDWKFCRNQSIGDNSTVRVDNLQPYTKYRFRVALILSAHHEKELFSEQSVIISTLPMGTPRSEPAIDIPSQETFCLVEKLAPDTSYNVSVTMRNAVGEGPAAYTMVRTPLAPEIRIDEPKITLILGAEYTILSQGIDLLSDPAQVIYQSEHKIKGIAIHIGKKLLFVSDHTGFIYKAPLEVGADSKEVVLTPEPGNNYLPSILSIDWLNDHLYMLVKVKTMYGTKWQISRCDLNGARLTVVIAGLQKQPSHIEVDPYNGYLFWVISGGLFRLDLGDVSNGVRHEVRPIPILNGTDLGAFAIDFIRFKIFIPIQDNNTVLSIDLEGKNQDDIRKNTQSPKFRVVKSLAVANQIFYWTNGEDVLNEEYHTIQKNYYHNAFPDQSNLNFSFVRINHSSAQPIPVPVNPPSKVQALLSVNKGIVSWHMPELLPIQGKSAWQEWNYILEITDEDDNNNTNTFGNIRDTRHSADRLKPNTSYKFRIAAYTLAGRGPWSKEFRTRTLKSPHDRYLIWSSNAGLLQSDILGENIHQLVSKRNVSYQNISDIAWYEDTVYFVSNFTLRYYNRTNKTSEPLLGFDGVQSIAVDWIGQRLYWFKPLTMFIIRSTFTGYEQEPILFHNAKNLDIKIDSLRGDMYFSSPYTVEYCRLNGKDRKEYVRFEPFYGKQIMGITLDLDNDRIYWLVRTYDGSFLYNSRMGHPGSEAAGHRLEDTALQGPLIYFSDRLLWLQDEQTVIIGNMTGKNQALIKNTELMGLKAFSVIDPTHHEYPNKTHKPNVVPGQINPSSFNITGNWRSFEITWEPNTDVTYGDVYYEVRFLGITWETEIPSFTYSNDSIAPYSKIYVSVRAVTYWATSKLTKVNLYTPAAPPSAPTNLRVFLTHRHEEFGGKLNIEATLRWNPPHQPNGPIQGYNIDCWYEPNGGASPEIRSCNHTDIVQANVREKSISNLLPNMIYYFRVQAFSSAGFGEMTDTIKLNTTKESPVPKVLIASGEEIFTVDLDLNRNISVVNTGSRVYHLDYINTENRLFWITENNELFSSFGSSKTKLITLSHAPLSLTVDWIERIVYWSQMLNDSGTAIYALNLNQFEGEKAMPTLKLERPGFVHSLHISPIDRLLFWVETDVLYAKYGLLMMYDLYSDTTTRFLEHNPTLVHRKLLMNTSGFDRPSVIWSDQLYRLFSTGIQSNQSTFINFSYNENMKNLAMDSGRIYWTKNMTLYAENSQDQYTYQMNVSNVQQIVTFYHQEYPNRECLLPLKIYSNKYEPKLLEKKERSLILKLPAPEMKEKCKFKLAGVKYTILYKIVENDLDEPCRYDVCTSVLSYEDTKEIDHLQPFVKYKFQISLNNYYGEHLRPPVPFGPIVAFQTAIGSPTEPRNLVAETISPTEATVQWLPPLELNGESVWYEVHWQTDHAINGVTNRQQQFVQNYEYDVRNIHSTVTINITRLLPDQPYSIWVRAYTSNTTYSETGPVQIETLPEPENITIVEATPYSLRIHWNHYPNSSKYILEYTNNSVDSSVMVFSSENLSNDDDATGDNDILVENLQPKTMYKFSVLLYFSKREKPYRWPPNSRFVFETLGDKPTAPGKPVILYVRGDVYQVSWEAAKENGASIKEYCLEGLHNGVSNRVARSAEFSDDALNYTTMINTIPLLVDEHEPPEEKWKVYYNGTDNYWIIKDLQPITQYSFRVQARNSYGWGPYSNISEPIREPLISNPRRDYIILAILVPVMVTIFIILGGYILCAFLRRVPDKKMFNDPTLRRDVELANLRELPRGSNFVQNTNFLYSQGPLTDADIALLPQIRRDQITLTSFLGSGAFGEVYEGLVNIAIDQTSTRVAIKTLRKGATEQEKGEFLQEAHLMSNFKHEHILRLIGVCFDMDSLYIIMELMQGGDLLSFLRQSRPSMGNPATLSLYDLVTICVDIASGCRYLEEMHFVHRDLACRNCLVSSVDPNNRVVKIGDFGLARDIYKNDYYRKDGEGLLPVRWMSPESLVDGVFTSQSDIWAFGVLCWEIMTLGQQPYPARTNVEVLHYVRDGGRLGRPTDCPEELYQLMLKCWSYRPEDRPTFRYCLEVLQELKKNTSENIEITDYNSDSLRRPQNGSLKFSCNGHDRIEPPIIVTPTSSTASPHTPKYLELIYDENDDPISVLTDGYEIPINDGCLSPSSFNLIQSSDPSSDCLDLGLDKERTFSSSSTVSEHSLCPTSELAPVASSPSSLQQILKVTLPNSKEDCQSNETLLVPIGGSCSGSGNDCSGQSEKVKPFYTNSKIEEVFNYDGKTKM